MSLCSWTFKSQLRGRQSCFEKVRLKVSLTLQCVFQRDCRFPLHVEAAAWVPETKKLRLRCDLPCTTKPEVGTTWYVQRRITTVENSCDVVRQSFSSDVHSTKGAGCAVLGGEPSIWMLSIRAQHEPQTGCMYGRKGEASTGAETHSSLQCRRAQTV
ncbi:hypothetical protein BDU57DRAFT_523717 [Ampelomyces quisqualis]|uniref:Uncharacterized protein n=1 Tax=Ampelomyces quisqualis TaxID=50730 RepID=A0A6A5Q8P8_AMPQU|nr:hypothetical protein BDU57DRAFT_523717 [Ampelomyces quisqualis]